MTISNYKPIDNGAGAVGAFEDDAPVGAAIANRLVNNTQWIHQNRLAKHAKAWDYTVFDNQNLIFFTSADDPADATGYRGYVGGGSLTDDTETIGVQFSTHPSTPMAIPFGWRVSPGAKFINILVALKVENAVGGMAAYARFNGQVIPTAPNAEVRRGDTFAPPAVATDFFNSSTRDDYEDSYTEVALTSTNGTNGLSYYQLQFEIPGKLQGEAFQEHSYQTGEIFLCFQSGYDPLGGTQQVATPSGPALSRGNRVIQTNDNMSKYSGINNPGKFHKLVKFTYTGTARTETWHHVLQMRPADITIAPFAANNPVEYVLWPSIPPDVVPPSLTEGAGSGASEGTGLQLGDNFDIYDLTVFTIASVTIEEAYA